MFGKLLFTGSWFLLRQQLIEVEQLTGIYCEMDMLCWPMEYNIIMWVWLGLVIAIAVKISLSTRVGVFLSNVKWRSLLKNFFFLPSSFFSRTTVLINFLCIDFFPLVVEFYHNKVSNKQ